MAEIVVSVIAKIAKCLVSPIGRQCSYLFKYKNNFDSLKQEVKKLTDAKEFVRHKVDDAKRKGEEIEQRVENWMKSVDKIMEEAGKITENEEKAKNKCFKGLCPNLKKRYQLSKHAVRTVETITGLQEEGKFERVSYKTIPQEIWLPATQGFEFFESRMSTLRAIQNALSDPNVNMVGVYGMGGIGKTTLVKEIAREAEKDKLFEQVVFANVSQTPDIKKIQGEIADKLGLEFREETESGRARKLRERLGKEKKILVILDNIWTGLDLEIIGIPFGDDHKGCKVLITARSQDILSCNMNCTSNFQVAILNEAEAWNLFEKTIGDYIETNDLKSVAIDVAKECKGLPIAIVTAARALRNKKMSQWKNALQELRRPSKKSFTGVLGAAYSTIELSYNHLEDDELKSTFLLCSLMEDNAVILDLLKYCTGLGLLQSINTMEEARDRIDTLVRELHASCLLLLDQTGEGFSMHDIVRDVALSIAARNQHVFSVRNEVVPIKWPNKDTLKHCTAFGLYKSNICEFPEGLKCPQLKLLLLRNENSFVQIPENFFRHMTELQVLDLTEMQFLSLPLSIHYLVNLRTLCLDYCELGNIIIIGELRKLEILSLISSDIEQLPKEIGQLSWLRLLDLSRCSKLKSIPPNVLSSLSRLEELYMGNTFIQWETEGINCERRNASLHELKHLPDLTNLEIQIKDANILPKGLFSEKLKRYQIYIGDNWDWSREYESARTLKLKLNTSIFMEDELIIQLKGIEVLYIDEVQHIRNVLYEEYKEGFAQLKYLYVQNNPYILCIMEYFMVWVPHEAFPLLESLSFSNLINLEKICHGPLTAETFCKLKIIKVENCYKLKTVFSFCIVKSLPQLQTLEVIECESMGEIFEIYVKNNEVMDKIEFCHIRSLTLKSLQQLKSFCSKVEIPSTSQNGRKKHKQIYLDDKVNSDPVALFSEMVVLPNLETLEVHAINFETIWHNRHPSISSCVQNLTRLIMQGCGNLKYLFSSSTIKSFLNLQYLEICSCPLLREIIIMEELREEEKYIMFPQLNFLKVKDLESLTRFCSENHINFPSLRHLQIEQCPKFKTFSLKDISMHLTAGEQLEIQPFFNEKVAFPELEDMMISHLDNLKMIWHNKLALGSFCKLKYMEVEGCDELLTLFPSNMLGRFPSLVSMIVNRCQSLNNIFPASIARRPLQLEEIIIVHCRLLEEIVAKEEGAEISTVRFFFPKVTSLILGCLPKLTNFYPGVHTSEWPVLKKLEVYDCEKAKVFVSEFLQKNKNEDQICIPAQQPWFFVEKIIPGLEHMRLKGNYITMICQGPFEGHFFSKLKYLCIIEDESVVIQFGLLDRFYNLETLALWHGSYKELLSYGEVEKHVGTLTRIKTLELLRLSDLKHFWIPDSRLNLILQNLESLEVEYCGNLIILPSLASFQNLTTLKVFHCNGMINLVTSSTAKSLVRLKDMHIEECKMMTEIIAEEDVAEDEIVFNKLQTLNLVGLESLTSFCLGNHTFKFPSLEVLLVRDCPKMKIFCGGALSTSKLHKVRENQEPPYTGFWEGDLNTTIQQLHNKTIMQHDNQAGLIKELNEMLMALREELTKEDWDDEAEEQEENAVESHTSDCGETSGTKVIDH